MTRIQALTWIDKYVAAWRTPGTSQLAAIFAKDISYQVSPWRKPIHGLTNLGLFWEQAREPKEVFILQKHIVAIDEMTVVARIFVRYAHDKPARWRDLWILQFDQKGLCIVFEEWPFSENQDDGQNL